MAESCRKSYPRRGHPRPGCDNAAQKYGAVELCREEATHPSREKPVIVPGASLLESSSSQFTLHLIPFIGQASLSVKNQAPLKTAAGSPLTWPDLAAALAM